MSEPEKTREVFGDYVSVYDFKQSIEDGATVPLFYENHIPELQLTNEDLNEELTEIRDFEANDLDIKKHRLRIEKEPLDEMFKDNDNPLRLLFVCAMWITGFDVPSLSTLYLDKPMKSHTLMQQIIARANRVFEGKNNGLIVDYMGVFRNLKISNGRLCERQERGGGRRSAGEE